MFKSLVDLIVFMLRSLVRLCLVVESLKHRVIKQFKMLVVNLQKNRETSRTPLTRTSVGISPQLHLVLPSMSALQTPGLKDQDC